MLEARQLDFVENCHERSHRPLSKSGGPCSAVVAKLERKKKLIQWKGCNLVLTDRATLESSAAN